MLHARDGKTPPPVSSIFAQSFTNDTFAIAPDGSSADWVGVARRMDTVFPTVRSFFIRLGNSLPRYASAIAKPDSSSGEQTMSTSISLASLPLSQRQTMQLRPRLQPIHLSRASHAREVFSSLYTS